MTTTAASADETSAKGRVGAVALVVSGNARFAALALDADHGIGEEIEGHAEYADEGSRLAALVGARPVITDAPRPALDLLVRAGTYVPTIWDVLELAALLVPACPAAGGLERVARFFGIALDATGLPAQARRLAMLFELLVATLDQVDTQTLLHVCRLGAGLDWPLRTFFSEALRARTVSPLESGALANGAPIGAWIAQGAAPRRRRVGTPQAHPPPLDPSEVAGRLAQDGAIARNLPGYEMRDEQVRMATLVAETLNAGGQLLVEAGTGTGKSLAYLLPAAMRALHAERRVVISTATTTLQDQLLEQDVPLVQSGLSRSQALRATVLKGRGNYICLQRWQSALHADDLAPAERMLLIKTLFWLPRTATGDRAELRLSAAEEDAWQRLSAVAEVCTPLRCAYHRIGVCFLARARRAAEESHIVIANHALLLSDLVSRSRVLPEYEILILDEAHHLEEEATQQLGWRLGERELLNRLERLWSPTAGGSGAIPEALGLIAASSGLQLAPALQTLAEQAQRAAIELGSVVRRFFEALGRLLEDPEVTSGGDDSALRVTAAVRAGSGWQELEQLWSEGAEPERQLERAVVEIIGELEAAAASAQAAGEPQSDAARDLCSELGGHLDYWREIGRRMTGCVHQPDPGTVHWISGAGRFRSPWLNAAPLDVAGLLRDRLFAQPEASVLVSATLTIDGSFDYVRRRLGLADARAVALGSSFDYARAALLYVPNDLPDPTQAGYQAVMERTILDVVTRLRGRTLVLFTSRAQLRATYQALRDPLAARGITLLAQGIDESSRTRMLEAFRRGSRVALFGTNAFWEGIDVVGEALSCVMVTRLPFAVPTDPIYAARAEQFDDPFRQYAIPQAVLRLKQGFGRLIRSRSDRGAVVVLDRRLVTRQYGQVFVRSLPACSVKQGPAGRAGHEIDEWLSPGRQLQLLPAGAEPVEA